MEIDASSPTKRVAGRLVQDSKSPKKRNMEVDDSNDSLNREANLREQPRSSKEKYSIVEDLSKLSKQMKAASENSPAKERRVLGKHLKSPSKRQKHDSQLAEERHFYEIFECVLDQIKDANELSDEEIEEAISNIISSFNYDLGHKFSDVDLSEPDMICGYLFRLATLDAGLVRYRTLQAIRNCGILEHALRQTKLRVVSLGGGPGNDILGFLSALHEVRQLRDCYLDVSIVDAVGAWKDCADVVKNLVQNCDFGSVSKMCRQNAVDIEFHETSLPCDSDDNCYDALANADIVIISRFISVLDWKPKREIMGNVYDLIKDSCLILFIDAPFYDDMLEYLECLYSSEDEYVLMETNNRFNHWEGRSSMAGISVLRKRIE